MRKFSKVVLITAGVLGVAGIGLSIGGVAMGANLSEIDIQRYYKGPKLKVLDWIVDFDWDEGETGEVEYDTSASGGSDSSAGEASGGRILLPAAPAAAGLFLPGRQGRRIFGKIG